MRDIPFSVFFNDTIHLFYVFNFKNIRLLCGNCGKSSDVIIFKNNLKHISLFAIFKWFLSSMYPRMKFIVIFDVLINRIVIKVNGI